jgi:hypothetical protein
VDNLSGVAGLDTEAIINTGATDLRSIVPPNELDTVVNAYSLAITRVFVLAAALSAGTILGALAMEWKSIKGPKSSENTQKTTEARPEEGENGAKSRSTTEMDG